MSDTPNNTNDQGYPMRARASGGHIRPVIFPRLSMVDLNTHKVVPKDAVVLDLDGVDLRELKRALARWKSWSSMTSEHDMIGRILDQIEAQTKPPRIEEPGLWGVVEAGARTGDHVWHRRVWVRHPKGWCDTTSLTRDWDNLIDPTPVREGVQS